MVMLLLLMVSAMRAAASFDGNQLGPLICRLADCCILLHSVQKVDFFFAPPERPQHAVNLGAALMPPTLSQAVGCSVCVALLGDYRLQVPSLIVTYGANRGGEMDYSDPLLYQHHKLQ